MNYLKCEITRSLFVGVDRDEGTGENWVVLKSAAEGIEDAVAKWYAQGLGYDYHQQKLVHRETSRFACGKI